MQDREERSKGIEIRVVDAFAIIKPETGLLWMDEAKVKDKTFIWVSVWWKTKTCLLWIIKSRTKDKKLYMDFGVMKD
jgi:hypothetical protein